MSAARPMVFVVAPDDEVAGRIRSRVTDGVDVARLSSANDAATMAMGRSPQLLVLDGDTDTAPRDLRVSRQDPSLRSVPLILASRTDSLRPLVGLVFDGTAPDWVVRLPSTNGHLDAALLACLGEAAQQTAAPSSDLQDGETVPATAGTEDATDPATDSRIAAAAGHPGRRPGPRCQKCSSAGCSRRHSSPRRAAEAARMAAGDRPARGQRRQPRGTRADDAQARR